MPPHQNPLFKAVFDPEVLKQSHDCFHALVVECADAATKFAQKANRTVQVLPSKKIIYEIAVSAYFDIARYKHFHFKDPKKDKSDAVKRAAYFTKWILRLRPLMVIDNERLEDPSPKDDPLAFINEDLAIQWSMLSIAQDYSRKDLLLRTQFHADFLYYLRMRELTTDGLLMAYEFLHKSASVSTDNVFMEFPLA